MSKESDSHHIARIPHDEEILARLLKTAGSREAPPREAYEQVLAAATGAWQDKVRRTRRRRWVYALAASVAVAAVVVGLVVRQPDPAQSPVQVASADRIAGQVFTLSSGESDWLDWGSDGRVIMTGDRLRTEEGSGAGLIMGPGVSFRIDESTEVWFESADCVHLLRGAVYLDVDPRRGSVGPVEIVTPAGSARHLGTQFELRYKDGGLRLRVREGRVMLRHESAEVTADAGVQVSVDATGRVEETAVARHDPDWGWVQALAPAPRESDPSLAGFLEWVERESGRDVHFATPELRDKAARTTLHGSREQLLPMAALSVMLQTTDFQYTMASESEILIEERRY